MNDPDDLLFPPPAGPAEDRLRAEILYRTTRRIHRRKLVRRGVLVGGFGLCFLTGMLCMSLLAPVRVETRVVFVPAPALAPRDEPQEAPEEVAPPVRRSPSELEVEAEKTLVRAESARIFRQAGDLYLLGERNHRAALRCYRNFLDEADAKDLKPSGEDTWLLTSLKQGRGENTPATEPVAPSPLADPLQPIIEAALHNHPGILKSAAKILKPEMGGAEAQAALDAERQRIVRAVYELSEQLQSARAMVRSYKARLDVAQDLMRRSTSHGEGTFDDQAWLSSHELEVRRLEAELKLYLGDSTAGDRKH